MTTEPILWVIRYALTAGEPQLAVMRIPDPVNSPDDAVHEVVVAPPDATGVFVGDRDGTGIAYLATAQLITRVDPVRPVLMLQASTATARPSPSWPMHFANVDDDDPIAGIAAHLHTTSPGVVVAWIKGHLFDQSDLTVADLLGGRHA